jgi:hypothetical protein
VASSGLRITLIASQIGFTDLVRIKSILLGTGGGQLPTSPRRVKVWVNRQDGVTFDEVQDLKAEQEFVLLEGSGTRGAVEYPVRMSRFGSVSSVTLFFVSHPLADICHAAILGHVLSRRHLATRHTPHSPTARVANTLRHPAAGADSLLCHRRATRATRTTRVSTTSVSWASRGC